MTDTFSPFPGRVFLSIFQVNEAFKPKRALSPIQDALFADLEKNGVSFFNGGRFTSYETIFDEIEASDLLVALIDIYWTSSTWKMIELFYAAGASAERDKKKIPNPRDCYIFDTSNNVNVRNILARDRVFPFDGSFADLVRVLGQRGLRP